MDDSTTGNTKQEMYTSGVASLIGVSSGISLDGESVRLPGDDGFEMNDDISSIHDGSSYYPNTSYYGSQAPPKIKIVGRVESMEEGTANINQLTPASIALSDQMRKADQRTKEEQEDKLSGTGGSNKTPPNMKKTSKIRIRNGNKKRNGCTPVWVQEAPLWLKVVIAISLALLVGAVVLVTLALSTALISQDKASTTLSSTSTPRPTDSGSTAQDPWAGVPDDNTWKGTPEPTEPLITKRPEEEEEGSSTSAPDASAPESDETDTNQSESTTTPEDNTSPETTMPEPETFDSQVTTFFVTGGRFTNDALDQLPGQLATMPVRGGTSFMVHLGDWNSPYATKCDRQSYQDVNDLFSNSSIPVYFVPGDNEFNDCPNPDEAMSFWHEYLLDYETQHWAAPSAWTVSKDDEDYPENFAFVHNDILFVGINLVGGIVHDSREWSTRQAANLQWIDDNYQQHKNTIKAFVLFAHADPDVSSNSPFYEPFKERVSREYNQVPVVLIHRNLGIEPWSWQTEYENIQNFSVVVVAGSSWPPLMGAIDFRQDNPFIFDQSNWYDQYMQHQRSTGVARH